GDPGATSGADLVNLPAVYRLRAGPAQRAVHRDRHEGGGHRGQAWGAENVAVGPLHHDREPRDVRPEPCPGPCAGNPWGGERGDRRRAAGVSGRQCPGLGARLHGHASEWWREAS
ncbi:unnamed protein product, partial [Hapterophycus canaliculatus]